MVTAITFHAIERLQERRSLTHLTRHISKIRKWNLPETGETTHKGFRYITRDGVLVTVLPPTKEMVHHRKEAEQEVS